MNRSDMLVVVSAILAAGAGVVGYESAAAENGRKVKTTLNYRYSYDGAKTEKANDIYWMYLDRPQGDGVSILMESGAEFKTAYKGDSATITREIVDVEDVVVPDTLGGKKVLRLGCDFYGELFRCCVAVSSISIPNGVTNFFDEGNSIAKHATLKRIVVAKDHPTYSTRDGVLYDKSGKTLVCCPAGIEGSFVIPDGVEVVGDTAFDGCFRIRNLTIPPSLRKVPGGLVPWGVGLREVHISDIAAWCGIEFDRTGLIMGDEAGSSNPLAQAHNLYLDGKLVTDVVIPDGVRSICDMAFIGCTSLRTVSLPDSVTNIGWRAFADCVSLEKIKFGASVKSIGECAFFNCVALHEVEIPDSVTSIGNPVGSFNILKSGIFNGCVSLRRVVLPKTLREIPENAFLGCAELSEVVIPKGVECIGAGAFYGCKRLTEIEIPKGVKEIGATGEFALDIKGVFEGCGLQEIEIPGSVKTIGPRAFAGCEDLSRVKMGPDTKSIGKEAFAGCKKLKFDEKPLSGLKMQNGIVVGRTTPLGETLDLTGARGISDDAIGGRLCMFPDDAIDPEVEKLRRIIFPNGMDTINFDTFSSCGNLQELTIPPSVKKINFKGLGGVAFCWKHLKKVNIRDVASWCKIDFDGEILMPCPYCCPGHAGVSSGTANPLDAGAALYLDGRRVTEVVVPGSVERVGRVAFYGYGVLERVVIEDGVKEIGDFAFYNCSNLVSLVIANSVTNIGDQAFAGCVGLEDITIPNRLRDSLKPYLPQMQNPFARIGKYRWSYRHFGTNATILGVFPAKGDIAIPSLITNGAAVYRVTGIGYEAFKDCRELTSVKIPNTIADVGNDPNVISDHCGSRAFGGCDGLADKDGFIIVGDVLFGYKGKGGEVTIPDGVKRIADLAFNGCSSLTRVTMPDSVKSIGRCAFQSCRGLADITIGRGVTCIGDSAFWHCDGLKSVMIGERVENIEHDAFRGLEGLTSLTIPSSVTNIEWQAFEGCRGLKSVAIPSGLTNVGWCAFAKCDGLVRDGFIIVGDVVYGYYGTGGDVVIPDGVTRIDSLDGSEWPSRAVFKSVTIPKSVVEINCFNGDNRPSSFIVADDNPAYTVVSGLLLTKDKKTLVEAPRGL